MSFSEAHDILEVFCQFCKVLPRTLLFFQAVQKTAEGFTSYPVYLS